MNRQESTSSPVTSDAIAVSIFLEEFPVRKFYPDVMKSRTINLCHKQVRENQWEI